MKTAISCAAALPGLLLLYAGCAQGTTPREDAMATGVGQGASSAQGPAMPQPPPEPLQDENGCIPGEMPFSGELMGQFGAIRATVAGQEYLLQVNEWNSTEPQLVAYGGDFFFKIMQQDAMVPTNGGPTGYPSMFIGANSGNTTSGSNLPKAIAELTSVPTHWTWNDGGTLADTDANSYNVAYDVWFSVGPEGDPDAYGPSGGFLMVWLYDPPDAQPIGSVGHYNVEIPGVPGAWNAWVGTNGSTPIISYVATEPVYGVSFDLNAFIQDALLNRPGTLDPSWYLSNVFIGFEIWRGGVGLETTQFCVVVN